jgi:hypothetical protein
MNAYDWNFFCDMLHQMYTMYANEINKFRYKIWNQN